MRKCSTKCLTLHTYTFLQRQQAAKSCHWWNPRFWLVKRIVCMSHQQCVKWPHVSRPLIGRRECCVYVPPTRVVNFGFWLVDDMSSVCPTKWWVFEKERLPTSDSQVVFNGVSPTKYDIFLSVIDLFKRSYCFILTPHYYDSFMMWPTGYASTMLVPPTPSFEQFLKINSIIFRKASEWRHHICISEISRTYKVTYYSHIHKNSPPHAKE